MFYRYTLDILIFIFLLLSIGETCILPKIETDKQTLSITSRKKLIILSAAFIIIIISILLHTTNFFKIYLFISFSILILGHAVWITLNKKLLNFFIAIACALIIIEWRIYFPSIVSHDVFLFASILWIGSFFSLFKVLTTKSFVVISVIWFLYDITYIWLTPLAHQVLTSTATVAFPLSIITANNAIGIADLLWANLFLAVLSEMREKLFATVILVLSDTALTIVAEKNHIGLFPLLVLWIPCGLGIFYLGRCYKK